MLDPIVTASSSSSAPVGLILVNVVLFALTIGVIVLVIRHNRRRRTTLDPAYQGAPVAQGVVTERSYRYRQVNNLWLYRITYHVYPKTGPQFLGWEDKYLRPITEPPHFEVGTNHLVAYYPGRTEVRSLPPRR